MPSIAEILKVIKEEPTLEHASKKLGIPVERLRLYAAGLAGNGLARLGGTQYKCDCSTCPFAKFCTLPFKRQPSGQP